MAYDEFFLIARYSDRTKSARFGAEAGIGDDCALLNIPERKTLTISTDTLVADNHFLPDIDSTDLTHEALAASLSDPTTMGTEPARLMLVLTLPEADETQLEAFNDSLFVQLGCYDMQLIGGDITRGPLSIALSIHGFAPPRCTMKRVGAKSRDWIYAIGTPGDGAADLAILRNRLTVDKPSDADYLLARHLHPMPRMLQGQALRDLATSTIDLSDGLTSDLGHILKASGYGACIDFDTMPYPDTILCQVEPEQALHWALAGGEDYELCFTVPELSHGALDAALSHLGACFTCVGQITSESEGL